MCVIRECLSSHLAESLAIWTEQEVWMATPAPRRHATAFGTANPHLLHGQVGRRPHQNAGILTHSDFCISLRLLLEGLLTRIPRSFRATRPPAAAPGRTDRHPRTTREVRHFSERPAYYTRCRYYHSPHTNVPLVSTMSWEDF